VKLELSGGHTIVGQGVRLEIEVVREGGREVPEPAMPAALSDEAGVFRVEGPDVSTGSHSVLINGRVTSEASRTYTFLIIPTQPGRHEISTYAMDGDERVESNVVVLEVGGEAADTEPVQRMGKPLGPRDSIFLWSAVDKVRAYVGEQITYRLDVYERVRANISLRNLPSFQDFWAIELPEGSPTRELVGDVPYRVHPGLRRALFAQRAGTLTIGSADATVEQRMGFFGPPRRRDLPQHVLGPAIEVEVLPLPVEGRPADFSANNVGRYSIRTEVDQEVLEPGKPFSLTVTIEGQGNLRFLDPGAWPEVEGVRRYDPKEETEISPGTVVSGTRRYRFLMIPERHGELVIPAHAFSFFDPEREAYETVASEPIHLHVKGGRETVSADSTRGIDTEQVAGDGGEDRLAAMFAGDTLPRHSPRESWLTDRRFWQAMLGAPATLAVGALAGLLWRRLGPGRAGRERALQRARRRELLAAARAALDSGEGFHGALGRLLQELAVDRAGSDGTGLPRPELMALLSQRGVAVGDLDRLRDLLDRCDAARFGAQSGGRKEREALLEDVVKLVKRSSLVRGKGGEP
jgi:hypothetical protein